MDSQTWPGKLFLAVCLGEEVCSLSDALLLVERASGMSGTATFVSQRYKDGPLVVASEDELAVGPHRLGFYMERFSLAFSNVFVSLAWNKSRPESGRMFVMLTDGEPMVACNLISLITTVVGKASVRKVTVALQENAIASTEGDSLLETLMQRWPVEVATVNRGFVACPLCGTIDSLQLALEF